MTRSTFAVAALLLMSSIAQAHSKLESSLPADKALLASAPHEVALHFSEPVRLTAVSVMRSGGERQNLAGLPSDFQKDFTVASPGLADGEYSVSWRALAPDSHVMTGTFTFSVGATGAASHAEHARPAEHADHADRSAAPAHQH
jgi:methionine-rich copper-binding protein CopC